MFDQRLLAFPDVHRDPLRAPAGGPTSRSISIVVRRRAGWNRESTDYHRGPAVRRHPYRGRPHPTGRYRTARDAVLT
jgi:hypothetical protein